MMSIKTVDSNQARNNWRAMLDAALSQDTDVVITRYNKPVVVMLDYDDYLSIRAELAQKRTLRQAQRRLQEEALATMLASERVLAREWDTPEEDEAWQNL
jgi:prevent-host-death family protein